MSATVEPLPILVEEREVVLTPHRPVAELPVVWPAWQRVLFRYSLCHCLLYTLPMPLVGWLSTFSSGLAYLRWKLDWPELKEGAALWPQQAAGAISVWFRDTWQQVTTWMDANGLAPYEVIHQGTGSGDTGYGFARLLCIVVLSVALTVVWSVVQRRPVGYPRLGRWLHLHTRWFVGLVVLGYGLAKFYGGQFGSLGPSRLLQEIGETPPMTMVGTFMQASPAYELFGGAGEVLGALLLFHHRTALLGAFVTIGVMTNVSALNWLCGVPVKISSTHLLLFSVALLAPYAGRLWSLFITNRPSLPVDMRVVKSAWLAVPLALFGWTWIGCHLVDSHFWRTRFLASNAQRMATPELYGVWRVERMLVDGVEVPASDATRWRDLAIDRGPSLRARELTGRVHSFGLTEKLPDNTLIVRPMPKGEETTWTVARGAKLVPERNLVPLRPADRQKPIDVERRTLVVQGAWGGKTIEVHAVERGFPIQVPFRLRQEFPDMW
jgi:hypothetical protein